MTGAEIILKDLSIGYTGRRRGRDGRRSGASNGCGVVNGVGRGNGSGVVSGVGRSNGEGRTLIANANVVFPAGTLTALVGRNGTGKSTLLRVMAGLAKPLSGEVLIRNVDFVTSHSVGSASTGAGSDLSDSATAAYTTSAVGTPVASLPPRMLASTVGFVSTERVRITNLKVYDVVALGRTPYTDWIGNLTPEDTAAVAEALALVDMGDFATATMDTLSDGEAQKVMIARVLAQDTPVILLDEPTAFLDFYARREVCELLARLAREQGKTIVFSSHDLALVAETADLRLEIADGAARIIRTDKKI